MRKLKITATYKVINKQLDELVKTALGYNLSADDENFLIQHEPIGYKERLLKSSEVFILQEIKRNSIDDFSVNYIIEEVNKDLLKLIDRNRYKCGEFKKFRAWYIFQTIKKLQKQ